MGKRWERDGKEIGKRWERDGKRWERYGEKMVKRCGKDGKEMGKRWERDGKEVGKRWERGGEKMGKRWERLDAVPASRCLHPACRRYVCQVTGFSPLLCCLPCFLAGAVLWRPRSYIVVLDVDGAAAQRSYIVVLDVDGAAAQRRTHRFPAPSAKLCQI